MLTDVNIQQRYDWCLDNHVAYFQDLEGADRVAFAALLTTVVDVDEMMLVYSPGTGKLLFLPEDLEEMTDENRHVVLDEMKLKPPQLLLFGAVTAPELLNPLTCDAEGARFHPKRKGIVQIRRLCGVSEYQRKSKNHARGDAKYEDITMNGAVYKHAMVGPGGLGDAMTKYYGDPDQDDGVRTTAEGVPIGLTRAAAKNAKVVKRDAAAAAAAGAAEDEAEPDAYSDQDVDVEGATLGDQDASQTPDQAHSSSSASQLRQQRPVSHRIQQDNAGGHGFNNFQSGSATLPQQEMVKEMRERYGYEVFCQPKNSPCFNMLDLGFWNSLKARVRERGKTLAKPTKANYGLIQAQMWAIIKDVVAEYDATRLFNIAVKKQVMINRCIDLLGGPMKVDPHLGVRRFWGTRE